jgi:(p)ppGpp synthase/HD superfamily hydrolase
MVTTSYLQSTERQQVAHARQLFDSLMTESGTVRRTTFMIETLTRWQVEAPGVLAALLMPILRQECVPELELIKQFGIRPVHIAQTVLIYLDKAHREPSRKKPMRELHAEVLREFMVAAYSNIEAILICVADHLATAATLDEQGNQVRLQWAHRHTGVYLALLEMLGMWAYRRDLGNLSLALLDMNQYERLERRVSQLNERHDGLFFEVKRTLVAVLRGTSILADVRLHYTTPISMHLTARRRSQGETLRKDDMLRVDVLVRNEHDCYTVLGLIHHLWPPQTGGRVHDFIAVPRFNGYRCLNTNVFFDSTQPVEFRIVTKEMADINAYGVVASMHHPLPVKNAWWTDLKLAEVVNHRPKNAIGVFTPSGEMIYPLKPGSTMVDLAFRIHSALGPYARQFYANGKQVSYQYRLHHCDLIDIEYDMKYPNIKPEWMDAAMTSVAQNNIRRFLRQRNQSPHKGRRLIDNVLEREMNIYRMRFPRDKVEHTLEKVARKFGFPVLESLYVSVLEGDIAPDEVVAAMIDEELSGYIVLADGQRWPADRIRISRKWMQESGQYKWERRSRVMPGEEIAGRIKGRGTAQYLVVYPADRAPQHVETVPLRWQSATTLREAAEITVLAEPQHGITGTVLAAAYAEGSENERDGLIVHRVNAELQDGSAAINLVVDAPSFEPIRRFQASLKTMQDQGMVHEFDIWQLLPGQKLMISGKADKRSQNPYTLSQIRDRAMFFGRENEIAEVIQQIKQDQNLIILYGQKRIGKTSLIYHLAENLLPEACDVLPVPVDALSLAPFTTVNFLVALAEEAQRRLVGALTRPEDRVGLRLRARDLEQDPFNRFAMWIKLVEKRLHGRRLFFMVDEFTRAEEEFKRGNLDATFFDNLQWLVGNQRIGCLLCVHDNVYEPESRSWNILQRGHPVRLDSLDKLSAGRLVRQPLARVYQYTGEAVNHILEQTNCHPFYIHAVCQELASQMSQMPQEQITREDVDRAITLVLRQGRHYFNHYENAVGKFSWRTVRILAFLAAEGNRWVTRDEIFAALEHLGVATSRWAISQALYELYRAAIVDVRKAASSNVYRIPIGLLQFWLRQNTHPKISQELLQEDN